MIINKKYLQLSRSCEGTLRFPPWFSVGIHIDFHKKYIDFHFYDFILTIGMPYWFKPTPSEGEKS